MFQRDDGIWVFSREEFCCERWVYRAGQHVVFAGPTQNGKTKLAFQLLEYTASNELPAHVAVSKPKDKVSHEEGTRLGYRRSEVYPYPAHIKDVFKDQRPAGYLLWPDMSDPETAILRAQRETRSLINGVYAEGAKGKKCILVLDDTVTKSKILMLDKEMVMVLTMSGAMGIGGWFFVQKPTGAGNTALWSFSQSDHLFLAKDPDKRNRERYNEIGGFDSKEVERICLTLKRFQFLYLEREHRYMCIIDAS